MYTMQHTSMWMSSSQDQIALILLLSSCTDKFRRVGLKAIVREDEADDSRSRP